MINFLKNRIFKKQKKKDIKRLLKCAENLGKIARIKEASGLPIDEELGLIQEIYKAIGENNA